MPIQQATVTTARTRLAAGLVAPVLAGLLLTAPSVQAETIYKYIDSNGNIVFTDHPTRGAQKIHVHPPPPIPLTQIQMPDDDQAKPAPPARQSDGDAKPSNGTNPATAKQKAPAQSPRSSPSAPDAGQPTRQQLPVTRLSPHKPAQTPPSAQANPTPSEQASGGIASPTGHPKATANNGHYQTLTVVRPQPGLQNAGPGGTMIVQLKLKPELDETAGDRIRLTVDGHSVVDDSTGLRHLINGLKPGRHTLIATVVHNGHSLIQSAPVTFELAKSPK